MSNHDDRHARDLQFIQQLKTATLQKLFDIWRNHQHKKVPAWKKVAIDRALARARAPKPDKDDGQ